MALGQQLREARLKKNVTTAQVAAATQILTHILDDLEHENFTRLTAPVYAKGFIKLYAQYLGLDPQPLIQDYTARFARGPGASSRTVPPQREAPAPSRPAKPIINVPEPVVEPIIKPEAVPEPAAEVAPSPAAEPEPVPPTEPARSSPDLFSAATDLPHANPDAPKKGWASSGRDRKSIHTELQRHGWLRNRPTGSFLKYIPLALGIILILVFVISSLNRLHNKKPTPETVVAPLNEPKEDVRLVTDPPAPYLN